MMNKRNELWIKFEVFFLFVDFKVILLIVMLANVYKETVFMIDFVDPKKKVVAAQLMQQVWNEAGSGYWMWIVGAILGDLMMKRFLRMLHDE